MMVVIRIRQIIRNQLPGILFLTFNMPPFSALENTILIYLNTTFETPSVALLPEIKLTY
jgi:hypothetical protein